MKKVKFILSNFMISPFLIYLFDRIAINYNFTIPINIFTILIVGLFSIPGLCMLVVIFLLI